MEDYNSDDIIDRMKVLASKGDVNTFSKVVYEYLTKDPESVYDDITPKEEKLLAINLLIKHFEKAEDYERCAGLHKLVVGLNEREE